MWTWSVFSSTARPGQTASKKSVLPMTSSGLSSNMARMSKDRAESSTGPWGPSSSRSVRFRRKVPKSTSIFAKPVARRRVTQLSPEGDRRTVQEG